MENVALQRNPIEACEYAVASRAMAGERQSGDAALVCARGEGILVAVVDGLGHGEEAAAAAEVAIRTLREQTGQPVDLLFQRCHENLQTTRGAAIALATLETASATVTWSGVGNVEGILVGPTQRGGHRKQSLTNRGGVVGYRLPAVQASVFQISPGDLLIFATDGIDERFTSGEIPRGPPDRVARAILERHGKATDDALVLVLRWRGRGGDESLPRRRS
jgi:serine phosphatase RsbU (regulator of sigma subunit)